MKPKSIKKFKIISVNFYLVPKYIKLEVQSFLLKRLIILKPHKAINNGYI